ncbi:MAG: hypothetical protein C0412_21875 [Flavobacterium sp.]|nr:hypothetical protein [Flavobacterium sp.]
MFVAGPVRAGVLGKLNLLDRVCFFIVLFLFGSINALIGCVCFFYLVIDDLNVDVGLFFV